MTETSILCPEGPVTCPPLWARGTCIENMNGKIRSGFVQFDEA